jgi:putative DNA methylase
LYVARLADGTSVPVLYYFWVKQAECPSCDTIVDLFPSRIFARHAYPRKYSEARAVCPHCGDINLIRFDSTDVICTSCGSGYDASVGKPLKMQ